MTGTSPNLKFGVQVTADGGLDFLIIEEGSNDVRAVELTPSEARAMAAFLIDGAAQVDPRGHLAEIEAAAVSLGMQLALANMPVQPGTGH